MSQRIRICGEEGERREGERRRKTDDSRGRQPRGGKTERMEEDEEKEKEERRSRGSGDWKMTIWCTWMGAFLF